MPKPDIVAREFTRPEIETILTSLISDHDWELERFVYVFGGLSTTTIRVDLKGRNSMILKIFYPNPAPVKVFQNAVNIITFLRDVLPVPFPLFSSEIQQIQISQNETFPCILMHYFPGSVAADRAIESGHADKFSVLAEVGKVLARMHSIPIPSGQFTSYEEGGAVELGHHMSGKFRKPVLAKKTADFSQLYLAELEHSPDMSSMHLGIIHGDPFLDNMLLDRESFELKGIVDFEDACVGPTLFDLGSAIAGSCFTETGHMQFELDFIAVESFLRGYASIRTISIAELESLTRMIRLALMCNCTFRFLMHASDAYMDLFVKWKYMREQDSHIRDKLSKTVD